MSKVEYGYIKHDGKTVTRKLNVSEYVLELDGIDYGNARASYSFDDVEFKTFELGVSNSYKHKRDLAIDLNE